MTGLSQYLSTMPTNRPSTHLLLDCINGADIPEPQVGVTGGMNIKQVWTVLVEDKLFDDAGVPRPVHHVNAFVEDRMHDWTLRGGLFRYHAHSTEKGARVRVLVLLQPEATALKDMTPGKFAFHASYDPAFRGTYGALKTFSIGVFRTVPKARGGCKKGAVVYRIKVPIDRRDDGFFRAMEVCRDLDSGWVPTVKSEVLR